MSNRLEKIQDFVGDIQTDQMRYVDSFISDNVSIFIPVTGPCFYAITEHSHPAYMFVYSFNNETKIKIAKKIINVPPRKLCIFSPDVKHQELNEDDTLRYIAILIKKKYFENQLGYYPIKKIKIFKGEYFSCSNQTINLAKKFISESENNFPGSKQVIDAISTELSHNIIRAIYNYNEVNNSIAERMEINRSIEFIHTNFNNKLSIQRLAGIANISKSHFTRVFKDETGLSPMEYVRRVRLDICKKMLKVSNKSITEIALECGFNSSAYLSDTFTRVYKISPSEYRNLYVQKKL